MSLFDKAIRWVFFLINPFIAMLISFKEYKLPYAKNVFWAFCVFYGFTFAIGAESQGNDIIRYLKELEYLYSKHEFTIRDIIDYFQTTGEIDLLRTIIAFFLSRFTDSQALLTMVYALIFGFFYSRNIWFVLNLLEGKIDILTKLLILGLLLVIPIWMINGFRMWTAFHIFMYGLLPYIFGRNRSKLIFLYLSFLVHFSFIIPISIFFIYRLLGNRIHSYFLFFILSIFIYEIDIGQVNQIVEPFLPESIIERTAGYRNEGVIESRKENSSNSNLVWYVRWNIVLLRWTFYFFLIYFYLSYKPETKSLKYWNGLFAINLLFFSIGNILSIIPSGGRFLRFSIFLTFVMIVLYLNQIRTDLRYRLLVQVFIPIFLLFIVVSIRIGFFSMSITTVLGNPIIAILSVGQNMSLNDLIK